MPTVQEKFGIAIEELNRCLLEKDDEIRLAFIAALCQESLLLVGPPGTGKTLIARAVAGDDGGGGAALTGSAMLVYVDAAIAEGRNTGIYLHEIIQTGSPTSTQTLMSELITFIDGCATRGAAGGAGGEWVAVVRRRAATAHRPHRQRHPRDPFRRPRRGIRGGTSGGTAHA